jgi:hypothetical protein
MKEKTDLRSGKHKGRGFVLVEVMVAALLAGLLVAPLANCMQSAVMMARHLRGEAAALSSKDLDVVVGAAWTWGPMVEAALWDLGPELTVTVRPPSRASLLVGAWADGWSIGEWEVEDGNRLNLMGSIWSGRAGRELTVRVREPHGQWGPPWRTVIPDAWGAVEGENAYGVIDGAGGEESNGDQGTVVHVPAFCAPELKTSWTTTVPGKVAAGVAFVLAPAGSGWCEVELRAQRQSWRGVDGRCLDVYY